MGIEWGSVLYLCGGGQRWRMQLGDKDHHPSHLGGCSTGAALRLGRIPEARTSYERAQSLARKSPSADFWLVVCGVEIKSCTAIDSCLRPTTIG